MGEIRSWYLWRWDLLGGQDLQDLQDLLGGQGQCRGCKVVWPLQALTWESIGNQLCVNKSFQRVVEGEGWNGEEFTCTLWRRKTSRWGNNTLQARQWSSFAILSNWKLWKEKWKEEATETPDWCGVEGGEDGQVGIEVVHLPKPLHNLYELHHVTLSLLRSW